MIDAWITFQTSLATPWLMALATFGLKSALLLGTVGLVLRVLPGLSAADRHLVWAVAASATLTIPVLAVVLPNVGVPVVLPMPAVGAGDEATVFSAPTTLVDAVVQGTGGASPLTNAAVSIAEAGGSGVNAAGLGSRAPESIYGGGGSGVAGPSATPGSAANAVLRSSDPVRPADSGWPAHPASLGSAKWRSWAPAAVVLLWATVTAWLLVSLLAGWTRLLRLERRGASVSDTRVDRVAQKVAARIGLGRRPVVLTGGPDAMPMTWGVWRCRVLLPQGAEDWPRDRLEAVLAHELAHARRRDYLAQFAVHLARAVQWFNPMLWVAASRMRLEREFACDDFVVASGLRDAPSYAADLLELARGYRRRIPAHTAALPVARPGKLRSRLMAVLDPERFRQPLPRPRAWAATAGILALMLPLSAMTPVAALNGRFADPPSVSEDGAPVPVHPNLIPLAQPKEIPQETALLCNRGDGEERRSLHVTDDGSITIQHEYGSCRSTVEIEGDIEFTRDFTTIERMPRDARFRIEVRRGDSDLRLDVRPGAGGVPEYIWRVDGEGQAFDEDARLWFERALLEVFRTSSYKATDRAEWMLSDGGVDAVFAEIDRLRSSHVKRRYYEAMLKRGDLDMAQVRRVMTGAAQAVESDHNLGTILITAAGTYAMDAATRSALIEASRSIESDHQQGKVFEQALKWPDLGEEEISALLMAAADGIESDHTLAGILMGLADRYPLDAALRGPYLRAAATLESDHRKGAVYEALLEQQDLTDSEIAEVLRAARTIDSDSRLARLLERLAETGLSEPATREAYLDAAAGIGSDSNLRSALEAFMLADGVDQQALVAMLRTSREIGSDSQLARLLVSVAERHPLEGEVRDAFLDALDAIGSDSQTRRVRRALDQAR